MLSDEIKLNDDIISIHYNKNIMIHFINTSINLLSKCVANIASKYRIYTAPSHGILYDGTVRTQRVAGDCTTLTSAICNL